MNLSKRNIKRSPFIVSIAELIPNELFKVIPVFCEHLKTIYTPIHLPLIPVLFVNFTFAVIMNYIL